MSLSTKKVLANKSKSVSVRPDSKNNRIKMNETVSKSSRRQGAKAKPDFMRQDVFAEVEKSNRRFEKYSKDERRAFAGKARALKPGYRAHEICSA